MFRAGPQFFSGSQRANANAREAAAVSVTLFSMITARRPGVVAPAYARQSSDNRLLSRSRNTVHECGNLTWHSFLWNHDSLTCPAPDYERHCR